MRFSKVFEGFADWWKAQLEKPITDYTIRITSHLKRHPEATLAEARGHKPKALPPLVLEEFLPEGIAPEVEVPPIYRVSYGLKAVPIHHEYYGFLLQVWSDDADYLRELDQKLEDLFVKLTEKWVGYKESEWWNFGMIGYEPPQEMFLRDPSLVDTWEWRVEKKGMILDLEKGDLSSV